MSRSLAELKKLAVEVLENRVYGSWMISEARGDSTTVFIKTGNAILPLDLWAEVSDRVTNPSGRPYRSLSNFIAFYLLDEEGIKGIEGTVHIYEYADKAMGDRTSNGVPYFSSFHTLNAWEFETLIGFVGNYQEIKEKFSPTVKVEGYLPANCSWRDQFAVGERKLRVTYWEFPVQSLHPDGYTFRLGYREGVEQNRNISVGASHCTISGVCELTEEEWNVYKERTR